MPQGQTWVDAGGGEHDTHIFEWLVGLLITSISALTAIVWRASSANTRLLLIESSIMRIETRLLTHEALRAHAGAAADMDAIKREVELLRVRHVDDLLAVHNDIVELRNHRGE